MTSAAPRTERTARLARVYGRAQVRFQRRLIEREAYLRRTTAGDGRLWPWRQGPVPDLTDDAWRLCHRLIRAVEQDAGLVRPER